MTGAPRRMMKLGQDHWQAELEPTTLRLTAEPVVAASRCKHNYLGARKTDYGVNWGDFGGTPTNAPPGQSPESRFHGRLHRNAAY